MRLPWPNKKSPEPTAGCEKTARSTTWEDAGAKSMASDPTGIGVLDASDIFSAPGSIVATRLVGLGRNGERV